MEELAEEGMPSTACPSFASRPDEKCIPGRRSSIHSMRSGPGYMRDLRRPSAAPVQPNGTKIQKLKGDEYDSVIARIMQRSEVTATKREQVEKVSSSIFDGATHRANILQLLRE